VSLVWQLRFESEYVTGIITPVDPTPIKVNGKSDAEDEKEDEVYDDDTFEEDEDKDEKVSNLVWFVRHVHTKRFRRMKRVTVLAATTTSNLSPIILKTKNATRISNPV
jgi:hypothetical protein